MATCSFDQLMLYTRIEILHCAPTKMWKYYMLIKTNNKNSYESATSETELSPLS